MLIDGQPGPLAPVEEWEAYLAELRELLAERDDPVGIIAAAIKSAEETIGRMKRGEWPYSDP